MGLGKTVQTIAMISYLAHQEQARQQATNGLQQQHGPFLIISPLSVASNW